MESSPELRSRMRAARRRLSAATLQEAGTLIARQTAELEEFQQARHVACFLSSDGEVDTAPLLDECWSSGKRVWLPIIGPGRTMRFAHFKKHTPLIANRLGIREPDPRQSGYIKAADLELVLTPLVAFDTRCHRLGMGGGYYDRVFDFLRGDAPPLRPVLVGIAHELQRVARIEPQHWDVPLSMVITPSNLYRIR